MVESEGKRLYKLTHPQKRIWLNENIYPNTPVHNIGGTVRIKGRVDFNLLEKSINSFLKRNEGLLLQLTEIDGEVKQYVSKYSFIRLDYYDFSVFDNPEEEFAKWIDEESSRVFELEDSKLFYFAMFKISDHYNGYLVKFHHIIADGWSISIMTDQICDTYMKLLKNQNVNDDIRFSYLEYIGNEEKYLTTKRFLKNKRFWNEKYSSLPETFLFKSTDDLKGNRVTFQLDKYFSQRIREMALKTKCSLNAFFVAFFIIYLYKATHERDIIIGTPVLNRSGKREKNMVGMFTSNMPFRFALDEKLTISEHLNMVKNDLMNCYFNQRYPYEFLVEDLELKRKGYDGLFQICVNYYNTRINSELNGASIDNIEFYNGYQLYSLQLIIKEWLDTGSITLSFDYKVMDYTKEKINDMYTRLTNLITQGLEGDGDKRISELCLLSEDEKDKYLYRFNSKEAWYPKSKTVSQLFEEQVEKSPDNVAVSFESTSLTYKELNRRANQVAQELVGRGICRDALVGIVTTHSLEAIIGILGVLKAGGAYIPIDPSYPPERINYILMDSKPSLLLTNISLNKDIIFHGKIIDLREERLYRGKSNNIVKRSGCNDLAYIIYTSGSTGKPKGVMINHTGLVNYVWWAKQVYIECEKEVFACFSSLAFDLTVTSILPPLVNGNTIAVYKNTHDEFSLYKIIRENKANILKLTPSHLLLLSNMDLRKSSVKKLIVGGEEFKTNSAKAVHKSFGDNIEIYNEYGPTEATVGCMLHKYDYENDKDPSVPIGLPAHNTDIYILDEDLKPLPSGYHGELYISGDSLAKGYFNSPDLTKEKFIENPFKKGSKMYRTGDIAVFLPSGRAMYVGRMDQQVKIRGYRIDPREIEKCLFSHENIINAVVIDREDDNGEKYLCAYIVETTKTPVTQLRLHLYKYLPGYMIPRHLISIDEIPLTKNGKIDSKSLPEPNKVRNTKEIPISPRNDKEKVVIRAISEVLKTENIRPGDNFYQIGGDSIKAILVSAKVNDYGYKLKTRDILTHPTIEQMTLYLSDAKALKKELRKDSSDVVKNTPIISWFFEQEIKNPNRYVQSIILEVKEEINKDDLKSFLSILINRHDALRLGFDFEEKKLFYIKDTEMKLDVEEYDFSGLNQNDLKVEIKKKCNSLISDMNSTKDLSVKASIYSIEGSKKLLFIAVHHIAIDLVSWRILLEELSKLIYQGNCKDDIVLPTQTDSYQSWANSLSRAGMSIFSNETDYWDDIDKTTFEFPTSNRKDNISLIDENDNDKLAKSLDRLLTRKILFEVNNSFNTKPVELLAISLGIAIMEYTNRTEAVFEMEGHGREDLFENLDISRTIGWFTSIYPVKLSTKSGYNKLQKIKTLKEQVRNVGNGGIGYSFLKYSTKSKASNSKNDRIKFNYLGDLDDITLKGKLKIYEDQFTFSNNDEEHTVAFLDINAGILDNQLVISMTFNEHKLSYEDCKKFLSIYLDTIEDLINYCCNLEKIEYTPSDFFYSDLSQDELDSLFL